MNIREAALATATLKALSDLVKERDAEVRAQMLETLVDSYDQLGIKSLDVKLPDGTKVAALALSIPKSKGATVTDNRTFSAWVSENYPTAIYQPPQPAASINAKWLEMFLAALKQTDEGAVDTKTGALVPGVDFLEAPAPKSFTVRFTDDGRAKVLNAFRQSLEDSDLLSLPEGD